MNYQGLKKAMVNNCMVVQGEPKRNKLWRALFYYQNLSFVFSSYLQTD
jgi:hypothetical protein